MVEEKLREGDNSGNLILPLLLSLFVVYVFVLHKQLQPPNTTLPNTRLSKISGLQ